MNQELLDEITIERQCRKYFDVELEVKELIARAIPTSATSKGTIFKAGGQVYLFMTSQGIQLLDDVRKIVQRMGCEAAEFLPLHGEAEYFDRIAREKFKAMFPGKPIVSDDDLRYYRNLTPYNPALVRISKIRGELRGFDARSHVWRKVKDYSYSKISPKHS
ncbi:MAG TPA: hypothetical protein VLA77_04165 [Candidatus Saccharimonadales bacterium]|nr:hypothetical protein [Candidatus Saccharimonadales bacterium]